MGELIMLNRFNTEQPKVNVHDLIDNWLTEATISKETKVNYKGDIKDFFYVVKSKELSSLTPQDFQVSLHDFDAYKIHQLNEREVKHSTIKRKVTAVKGFLLYVSSRYPEYNIDTSFFPLIKSLKSEAEGYATVHVNEVGEIAELASRTRNKGIVKKNLILFAFDSALRLEEILSIKTSDFIDYDSNHYFFSVIGKKNKRNERYVTKKFLHQITEEMGVDLSIEQKLFDISAGTIQRFFKNELQQDPKFAGRLVVFHSIRGAGLTAHYKLNGDPALTQEYAKHESFDTTRKYLMIDKNSFSGAYSELNYSDASVLESLTKEELLDLIKTTDPYIKHKLVRKLKQQECVLK
ncbi:tyrosine-type recombinase/integrase [Shouchella clausii]|uniref:tyrosine-type recombinase/integrase n=1 Tax=Shouchella clausii TaxID=79880 RepID=UPI001C73D737|nr:site-specific integrase [Shouchella clausii]MBX0320121.1 site-specific integrase [Shouchella clausii]MEB5480867.1 site-specific integrase [Shouchella clausii]